MGQTPREKLSQIPLPTRGSETGECFGRVVLTYLREDEAKPASFFILGTALHDTIEESIKYDWDYEKALKAIKAKLNYELGGLAVTEVLQTANRNMETIYEDAERMLFNWFNHVHPDGEKRHPVYKDYQWPPQVEVPFYRRDLGTRYPVWGSVDALFRKKITHAPMIVDWKSGTKKPQSDFQLNFYRFGLGLHGAEAHYHMLDRVQKRSIVVEAGEYSSTPIREAISHVERSKDAVLRGNLPEFAPDWYCDYCPVQHLCPAGGDFRDADKNMIVLKRLVKKAEALTDLEVLL